MLVLGAAIASVVVLATIDQRALTERVVARIVATTSDSLGREVTIESARGRLLPNPRITVTGLSIAGQPGDRPFLETEQLRVELRIWPIIRSFGREIVIDEVTAVGPKVNLIRDADGRWDVPRGRGAPSRQVRLTHLRTEDGTVRVIDRPASGDETAVALSQVDADVQLSNGKLSRVRTSAALASNDQNLAVDLAVDEEARAGRPSLRGTIELERARLERMGGIVPSGISGVLRGGSLTVTADVGTRKDGSYELHGDLRVSDVRMRAEETAEGRGRIVVQVDPESPSAFRAAIEHASLRGPGIELAGSLRFRGEPRSVWFDVHGPLVDLDVLLTAVPEKDEAKDEQAVLPPTLRRTLEETAASGALRVDRVVRGRLELQNLVARASLRAGVLELEEAQAQMHGGRVVGSGTQVDLRRAAPAWTLHARIENVELGSMMRGIAGDEALVGTLDASFDGTGAGAKWDEVRASASGTGVVRVRNGALTTGDMGTQAAVIAAQALRLAGGGSPRLVQDVRTRTEFEDVRVTFRIEQGWATLDEPLVIDAPFGRARLDGRIGLDRALDLRGVVILSPDFVERVAGVEPPFDIDVPMTIGGTMKDPRFSFAAPEELASQLAERAVREGARALEEEAGRRLDEGLRDLWRRLPIPGVD